MELDPKQQVSAFVSASFNAALPGGGSSQISVLALAIFRLDLIAEIDRLPSVKGQLLLGLRLLN